ncbi:MAG: metallophosphoesterase family protein [Gammaproteobacteria bacterium]
MADSILNRTGRTRVAVISDVHGNARAYAAALALARRRGFDRLVILGDLLTYGCDPAPVLELTREAIERDGALLIKGNHDQIYADLARGELSYYSMLPDWLRETVDWTAEAIVGADLEAMFVWLDRWEWDDALFAHANPFAYGDWTYLNGAAAFARASRALVDARRSFGVFGHTHRPKIVEVDESGESRVVSSLGEGALAIVHRRDRNGCLATLVDPGSIGQPRSREKASTMLFLTRGTAELEIELLPVSYDVAAHKRAILGTALSETTKAKLLGFFS